jgi:hypothetical protein
VQRNFLYTQESLEIQDAGFPGQEGVGKGGGSKAERKHTARVRVQWLVHFSFFTWSMGEEMQGQGKETALFKEGKRNS